MKHNYMLLFVIFLFKFMTSIFHWIKIAEFNNNIKGNSS